MQALLFRILETLFPLHRHEWSKALMLLSVATLLGVGASVSRAASEALFLTRFGVDFLPYVLLVNPALVLVSTTIYGTFASRVSNDRMMIYTALVPIPIILVMRLLITFDMSWTYFLLFTFVLAYASVVITSWAVYLPGHYDVQEAKRLLPFINSGMLIGTVLGGLGVALCVPIFGAPNVLFIWIGTLLAVVVLVQSVAKLFTTLDAEASKVRRTVQKPKSKPGALESLREGVTYSRSSALFMTTAIASIATVVALQLLDFEYSKIFARQYPDSAQLTAFLGAVDGLTTMLALAVQWFIVPRCIRGIGVKGTNLLFPHTLTAAFGGLLVAPSIGPAIFARFTRYSLMPSLRGTTRTLILNALPRKTGALVRSFNTGIVMPAGQGAGALALLVLKGFDMPLIIPLAGLLASACYVFYTFKQNAAYGDALLELLKEDKIHLLDLEDDEIRQLDTAAVATISERLRPDRQVRSRQTPGFATLHEQTDMELPSAQEEETLAAIELLRAIGNRHAFAALRQHLPYATPRLTAAALQALAAIDGKEAREILPPYLADEQPQVRLAALVGLRRLGDDTLRTQAARLLEDADVRVRAAALAIMLSDPETPGGERAARICEEMLSSDEKATHLAALSILADIPASPLHRYLYRGLDHVDVEIRREALRVLRQLAEVGRIHEVDVALLRSLEDTDAECRDLALQVLAALGTPEALEHMLVLLDDEQPRVREALTRAVRGFGKRAIEPLIGRLRSPQTSLIAKESALQALARLDGVQPDQLLPFWEGALRDVYLYKLMLVCLEESEPLETDTFLRVALRNEHDTMLSLLIQLLAVWTTPEVARLIESGLDDTDRQKRASALEALESLSERRFTRLFLPILDAGGGYASTWRDIARQQWGLVCGGTSMVIETCLQSSDKWVVIGALLAGQARAEALGEPWRQRVRQLAETAPDPEVRETARGVLGEAVTGQHRTFSLADVMLFLKRIPLYSTMNLDQLHTIATNFTERKVQAGEVIFREGDQSYELYLIVSGEVEVVKRYGEDDRMTLVSLSAGQFFGDMAIFENRPRSATVVATKSGVLLVLSPERFRDIIMQEPAISFEIFRELSARLRRVDEEPLEMADQSAG
jgi:HEAT repeat protein